MFNEYKDNVRLIKVWEDTVRWFQNDKKFRLIIRPSIKYKKNELHFRKKGKYSTEIVVFHEDTIDAAIRLKNSQCEYDPLVLNMASSWKPGGGVSKGSKAQEECLFRRSNYHQYLTKDLYPIQKGEVIYSRGVHIIKDLSYEYSDHSFISFIACPALRYPTLIKGHLSQEDYRVTVDKIRLIFQIAYIKEHDSLVLGALGCGAYRNPPADIIRAFKEVIKQYNGCFKHICFAILNKPYDRQNNYKLFRDALALP